MKRLMIPVPPPGCFRLACLFKALLLLGLFAAGNVRAQDWEGSFTLIPAGAPDMVLEGVGGGLIDDTAVSLNHPAAAPNQAWVITPKGEGFYFIRPAYSPTLVLTVSGGKTNNGTTVVLETESGKPWQLWSIRQNPNGSCCLLPKHAPTKGLDDFGGRKTVGAKQDIWNYNPSDEHLQWMLKPLAGAKVPAGYVNPLEMPKGVLKEFTFEESKVFPGTRRLVTVFIPAQYDGSQSACVYVRQDGYRANEKEMLERLIAAKEMPVTVGIFIKPGEMPAPEKSAGSRRNRCFEYDGVGDNYVRFLIDELLPSAAKQFDLKLSNSGNDRCIAGVSSGGIAAFNAAWERPDAFSRVFAGSGSFVAFRGGHEFPTLIRKFEAKPIRTYLTTGTNDMVNCAGDWYLLDQEVDKALTFSGYDHFFSIVNGGHGAGWNEHFSEAMRYLWKGWPEPVRVGPSAPRVRDVLKADAKWELAAQGYPEACSPAGNSKGEVFFINRAANKIHRLGLDGKVEVFINDAAQANGLCIGPRNELYTVSHQSGKIMRYDVSGQGGVVVMEGIQGNSLLARPDGSLYVTSNEGKKGGQVWLVKAGGKTLVDSGLKYATGLAYRPDQWLLSVADGLSKWLYSYQIMPDGALTNKERFFWLHVADWDDDAGAETVCFAKEGQMLVATRLGIQICADDGPTQVILPLPDRSRVTGACLGGTDLDTLFVFGGDKIWKRAVKLHAFGAFSPATKFNRTPL